MTTVGLRQVVGRLRGVLAMREAVALSDADLWLRYVRDHDAAALEALIRKHGSMVMGVCRRILRHEQDTEDAFQATFLVLVRKAGSLRSPATLANWLHGVARRTALAARTAAARRRAKESAVVPRMTMAAAPEDDLWPLLDQEIGRLAEKYRIAIVLCDLEGKTRAEVARQLGWAEGTVASRLARGRGILAKRLARRGLAGAVVAGALTGERAAAGVPTRLLRSVVETMRSLTAGSDAASSIVPTKAVSLSEKVLKSMLLNKARYAVTALLFLGITLLGAGGLLSRTSATEPAGEAQDDLPRRVQELKQQLRQMEKKLASLEREAQSGRDPREKCDTTFLCQRFKYRVPFEIGRTQTAEGGRVEIREVWGTRPQIEVGGQYLVRGKYVMPAGQLGVLHLFASANGPWGQTASLDLQSVEVDKQEGQFTLIHGMAGPGYFHVHLSAAERYSRCFADVYFGTGEYVWREKP